MSAKGTDYFFLSFQDGILFLNDGRRLHVLPNYSSQFSEWTPGDPVSCDLSLTSPAPGHFFIINLRNFQFVEARLGQEQDSSVPRVKDLYYSSGSWPA